MVLREGWFNETFAVGPAPAGAVALLVVDGDWYGSVRAALDRFYDAVPPGGVVFVDDFGYWPGARRALGDFLRARPDVEFPLVERYGVDILWWVKGLDHNRPE